MFEQIVLIKDLFFTVHLLDFPLWENKIAYFRV